MNEVVYETAVVVRQTELLHAQNSERSKVVNNEMRVSDKKSHTAGNQSFAVNGERKVRQAFVPLLRSYASIHLSFACCSVRIANRTFAMTLRFVCDSFAYLLCLSFAPLSVLFGPCARSHGEQFPNQVQRHGERMLFRCQTDSERMANASRMSRRGWKLCPLLVSYVRAAFTSSLEPIRHSFTKRSSVNSHAFGYHSASALQSF